MLIDAGIEEGEVSLDDSDTEVAIFDESVLGEELVGGVVAYEHLAWDEEAQNALLVLLRLLMTQLEGLC